MREDLWTTLEELGDREQSGRHAYRRARVMWIPLYVLAVTLIVIPGQGFGGELDLAGAAVGVLATLAVMTDVIQVRRGVWK